MAKPKKKQAPEPGRLDPTPEQWQRNVYEMVNPATIDSTEHRIGEVRRNLTTTPLDRYRHEGKLDGDRRKASRLWEAGDRFRLDWYWSGLAVAGVAGYGQRPGGGGHPAWLIPATHRALHHRKAFRAALKAVGDRAGAVLVAVCCLEHDVTMVGGGLGFAGRDRSAAGLASLRMALGSLADHYGA